MRKFRKLVEAGPIGLQPWAEKELEDYASEETKKNGEALIAKEINNIPKEKVKDIVKQHLIEIEQGQRDFRL